MGHLVKISSQYKWDAVLLYHFAFFARRCSEMLNGDYKGWAGIDVDLMEELLVQHRKQPIVSIPFVSVLPISDIDSNRRLMKASSLGDDSLEGSGRN